jgi:hypothetical protein
MTSLFAGSIETSGWAWGWSVFFSAVIFFLLWLLYANWEYTAHKKYKTWTIVTYVILSGLSIWLLFASEADNIVKICKLLLPFESA